MITHIANHVVLNLIICLLSTNVIRADSIPLSEKLDLHLLNQVRFKATHNSYQRSLPPSEQIDLYDVWEIELDFGMIAGSDDFFVGHDGPESKFDFNTLRDWLENILSASKLENHPLILKLEAKTDQPCRENSSNKFSCVETWPPDWQNRLEEYLIETAGTGRLITRYTFEELYNSSWPKISELGWKIIVSLQDDSNGRIVDTTTTRLFVRNIDGLTHRWPPIHDENGLKRALRSGVNRLIMDEAFRKPLTDSIPRFIKSSKEGEKN